MDCCGEGMLSGLIKLLHLLCPLFLLLLLLYQLHSRSSDIRSQSLGTPALSFCKLFVEEEKRGPHFPRFSSHKYKHLGFFFIHIGLYASSPFYSTEESGSLHWGLAHRSFTRNDSSASSKLTLSGRMTTVGWVPASQEVCLKSSVTTDG